MTFLASGGCATVFLRMLPKFKMAARGQLKKKLWAQKLKNLETEIIQNHIPYHNYGDVQVTFSRFY